MFAMHVLVIIENMDNMHGEKLKIFFLLNFNLYNGSRQDALFLSFILINNSTCFGQIYFPSIPTSLVVSKHTSMTNSNHCEYSVKTPDDGPVSLSETCRFVYQNKVEI